MSDLQLNDEKDLQLNNEKELQFIPNLIRVMKSSKYDRLYIMGAISAIGIIFSPAETYAKAIVIIVAAIFGFFKVLSLIYNTNILKNPMVIDTNTNVFSYFDEFSIKRKSLDLNKVKDLRVFYKNNKPYILELNLRDEVKDKDIEENVNIEAFDEGVINYFIKTIRDIKPQIEITTKNLENKKPKNKKVENSSNQIKE